MRHVEKLEKFMDSANYMDKLDYLKTVLPNALEEVLLRLDSEMERKLEAYVLDELIKEVAQEEDFE